MLLSAAFESRENTTSSFLLFTTTKTITLIRDGRMEVAEEGENATVSAAILYCVQRCVSVAS